MKLKNDSVFAEMAKLIAEGQADELQSKQKLLMSRDVYIEQKTTALILELEKAYKELLHHMEKGRELLLESLNLLPYAEQEHHAKEFLIAMNKLSLPIEIEQVSKAGSWQKFLGFTNETIFWIYSVGFKFFEEKKYENALALFLMLTLLNPAVSDNWISLGFSQKNLFLNTQALNSFFIASSLAAENPTPRYQSAEIYLCLGEFDKAAVELDALTHIVESQKIDSLRPLLESMINKIKNRQSL